MNKRICIAILSLLFILQARTEISAGENTFWGYLTSKNGSHINGSAIGGGYIYDSKKNEYYDYSGNISINLRNNIVFSDAFSDGMSAVVIKKDEQLFLGYIDTQGKMAVDPTWRMAYEYPPVYPNPFVDGLARVSILEGIVPYMLTDGTYYEQVQSRKYGFIDKKGNIAVNADYVDAKDFSEGLAAVYSDRWGFIDTSGNTVIEHVWDLAENFSEGKSVVKKDGKYGYINKAGKLVIDNIWDSATHFSEGLAVVRKDGISYVIDELGTVNGVIDDNLKTDLPNNKFSEGMLRVYKEQNGTRKYGFVNPNGKLIIPAEYLSAENFSCNVAAVKEQVTGEYVYINHIGDIVAKSKPTEKWLYISSFCDGFACVSVRIGDGMYYEEYPLTKQKRLVPEIENRVIKKNPISIISVVVDSSFVEMGNTPAFIRDSRTMVPVRFISEKLGNKVDWDEAEKTVTITSQNGKILTVRVGETSIYSDGKEIKMDTPAIIENGRTYVPVKFIANALGMKITWYEKTIYID